MALLTKQITDIIENLQESEQILIFEIVKRFLPDDVATADDLEAIAIAREEFRRGETISHNDIDWD